MLVVLWVDRGCSGLGSFDRISTMTIDRYCRAIEKTRNDTFQMLRRKKQFWRNMGFGEESLAVIETMFYRRPIRLVKIVNLLLLTIR